MLQRFLEKCSPEPNTGCWLWTGSVWRETNGDYGESYAFGKRERATRAAYREIACKEVPPGMLLRHTCDMPLCVNPDHLVPGTQSENVADRHKRGRTARGGRFRNAKLTDDIVREIRNSRITSRELALLYGVSDGLINQVRRGDKWRHVD
jgi:hypothetical protein